MYSTEAAALALGVDSKTLDNFITRAGRALVPQGRRGLDRQIDERALLIIAVAMLLGRDLGIAALPAVRLGMILVDGDHTAAVGTLGVLRFDIPRLKAVLQTALADAAEVYLPRIRGRRRKKGRDTSEEASRPSAW